MASQEPSPNERTVRQTAFALAGIGMMNATAALLGCALGWLVDSRLDSAPVFILIGLVIGLAAGIAATWREVRSYLGN